MAELGVVGPDGSAVWDKQGRIFFAGSVIEGLVEVAVDGGAIFAFELDIFRVYELELGDNGVVGLCEARQLIARSGLRVDLTGTVGHIDLGGDVAIFAERIGVKDKAAGDGAGNLSAVCRDATEILRAVVVADEVDGAAVGGKAWLGGIAVEQLSEDAGCAARCWRDGYMVRCV